MRWTQRFKGEWFCSVWQNRVVLTPRCWRQALEKQASFSGVTVTTSPLHREEHDISRKAVAQGMSECFRCPVCSCAPNAQLLAHETAGAARTRHSLRPLCLERDIGLANLGQNHAARSRTLVIPGRARYPRRKKTRGEKHGPEDSDRRSRCGWRVCRRPYGAGGRGRNVRRSMARACRAYEEARLA